MTLTKTLRTAKYLRIEKNTKNMLNNIRRNFKRKRLRLLMQAAYTSSVLKDMSQDVSIINSVVVPADKVTPVHLHSIYLLKTT